MNAPLKEIRTSPIVEELSDGTKIADWDYEVDEKLLPMPTYARILVMLVRRPQRIGKIIVPDRESDRQAHMYACFLGKVLKVGPGVGKHPMYKEQLELKPEHYPQVGDIAIFAKSQVLKFEMAGVPLVLMNEDEPRALIKKKDVTAQMLGSYRSL